VVRDDAYDLLAVRADAEYLYRAIMNIVANAIESMDSGGRLTITTKASSAVAVFPYSLPKGLNSWVKIEINDTGFGIAPEHVEKVFDPFFTTKKRGTGLGLAIAHRIIEDHEGRIAVRSVLGVGTSFTVILPAVT
jgi:signal transduction histidine kinase